jgi:hypothetical protein
LRKKEGLLFIRFQRREETFQLKIQSGGWPAARLPNKNYFILGHKHLAPGNRRCGKRRVAIQMFLRELRENISA